MMFIKDIQSHTERYLRLISPNGSLEEEFPKLKDGPRPGGYSGPFHCAHDALIWVWLAWHNQQNIIDINNVLQPIIKRSVEANMMLDANPYMREDHDSFLIQLAILAGCKPIMQVVANSIIEAGVEVKDNQYLQSWSGILKFRILGDKKREKEQCQIMHKWKPSRCNAWPIHRLVSSFVDRDYKTFNIILRKSCDKHWIIAEKEKALSKDSNGNNVLDIKKRSVNFLWPWVEGAFAKLAYYDEVDIKYDSPWLPLKFVHAEYE